MRKSKRVAGLFLLIMLLMLTLSPMTVFAKEGDSGSYAAGKLENSKDPLRGVTITQVEGQDAPLVELPNVQIEQAKNFVEKKGFDIVSLLQTFAQPFTIGLFIFGAFLALMGAFAKSSAMMKGFIVMGISVLIYAAVISAPELMDFGNLWLKS